MTFKPETDDFRSSPALDAIHILLQKKANVFAFDPIFQSKPNIENLPEECNICSNIEDVLENSEIALVFTRWEDFKSLNSEFLKQFMKNPIIIDGRGFLDKENFERGTYFKIGMNQKI